MHAYLIETGRMIAPFERGVGSMKVHRSTLAETQEHILRRLGCQVERVRSREQISRFPCLAIEDDLFFTHHAVKKFLKQVSAQESQVPRQAALKATELTERFFPVLQGNQATSAQGESLRTYPMFHIPGACETHELEAVANLVAIPYQFTRISARANRYFEESGRFVVPISLVFMMPVRHWASLLAVNMLGMTSHFQRYACEHAAATASLLPKAMWRSGSIRPSRLLGKSYFAGRGCRVAASAHVESSILGNRVKIAPGAVIRNCILGDGVQIGANAVVEGCTLGEKSVVNASVLVRSVVTEAEASLGTVFCQMSVLGRGSVICPEAGFMDTSLRGDAQLALDGRRIGSGSRLLGGCLGEEAFLGPGVHVSAGFEVPNNCVLVEHPRTVVRNVDEAVPDNVWRLDSRRLRRGQRSAAKNAQVEDRAA